MTFDEIVEAINATGDTFKSIVRTAAGYQANAESRYGKGGYACDVGETPTAAVQNLLRQRRFSQPVQTSLEDII